MERVDIWTFRVFPAPGATGAPATPRLSGRDLVGWDVETLDGHIGKVDEATDETGGSYLVVDTGFWIFGTKRMLPAAVVERVDADSRRVYVNLRKEDVKQAPDWDEHQRDDEEYRRRIANHYASGTRESIP
jgi:hypothetical protein